MVEEARFEQTKHGLVPEGDGWFVLNARDARWADRGRRGVVMTFEGEPEFGQVGVNLFVLWPGQPMSMYHWEADQEDFLVLSGEALLIVEGEERPLRQWDFVHTPPRVAHTIVGAGSGPAAILAIGAREHQAGEEWGGYPYSELAMRHDASAEEETNDPQVAYARFPAREPSAYRDGWLPQYYQAKDGEGLDDGGLSSDTPNRQGHRRHGVEPTSWQAEKVLAEALRGEPD